MRNRHHGFGIALLYVLIGAIVGSVLGQLLSPLWHPLGRVFFRLGSASSAPLTLDFGVVGIQLGLWLTLNLGGIIGLLGGFYWYLRRK